MTGTFKSHEGRSARSSLGRATVPDPGAAAAGFLPAALRPLRSVPHTGSGRAAEVPRCCAPGFWGGASRLARGHWALFFSGKPGALLPRAVRRALVVAMRTALAHAPGPGALTLHYPEAGAMRFRPERRAADRPGGAFPAAGAGLPAAAQERIPR